jgi:hypothetical protein
VGEGDDRLLLRRGIAVATEAQHEAVVARA